MRKKRRVEGDAKLLTLQNFKLDSDPNNPASLRLVVWAGGLVIRGWGFPFKTSTRPGVQIQMQTRQSKPPIQKHLVEKPSREGSLKKSQPFKPK